MELTGIGNENLEAFAPLMCGLSLEDHTLAVGAIMDGEAAGVALFNSLGEALMTDYLFVAEKFRRRGIGRALIEETMAAMGDQKPAALHVNYPEQSEELHGFFTSLKFKIYRVGQAWRVPASSFLSSPSFDKLVSPQQIHRVMRVGNLARKELQVLQNGMNAEDLDPSILEDRSVCRELSLVTIDNNTAKPVACILCRKQEKQIVVLYLVNFSHDVNQLVDLFRGLKDAVVRAEGTQSDLLFVTMDDRMEKLVKKLAASPADVVLTGNVVSGIRMLKGASELAEQAGGGMPAGWLADCRIPGSAAEKAEEDKTALTFALEALSKTQRTKRGRRFVQKAGTQARMMNTIMQFYAARRMAPDLVRKQTGETEPDCGRSADDHAAEALDSRGYIEGTFEFFRSVSMGGFDTDEDLERDAALYKLQYEMLPGDTGESDSRAKRAGEFLCALAGEDPGNAWRVMLKDLSELDVSRFDYSDDAAFAEADGPNSFSARFAALRYFSHCARILEAFGQEPETDADLRELKARAALVRDILQDYEFRALLLQSPYYALLADRDFDDINPKELAMRRDQTVDPLAREYLASLLDRRARTGFSRGKAAQECLREFR